MTSCFVARISNPGERFGKPFYEVDVPSPLRPNLLLWQQRVWRDAPRRDSRRGEAVIFSWSTFSTCSKSLGFGTLKTCPTNSFTTSERRATMFAGFAAISSYRGWSGLAGGLVRGFLRR